MDLKELITMLVTLITMVVIMGRGAWDKSKRKKVEQQQQANRTGEAQDEDYTLEEFLAGISQDVKKKKGTQKAAPSPVIHPPRAPQASTAKTSHRSTRDDFQFQTQLDYYKQKSAVADRQFKTEVEEQPFDALGAHIVSEDLIRTAEDHAYTLKETMRSSRVQQLLEKPGALRQMVLYHAILGPPKGSNG